MRGLLIDRADPARGRCCGGLLAPAAQRALRRAGLDLPQDVRVRPEPHSVHVRDLASGLEQRYRRHYVNLDRACFDAWLADLARERVRVWPGARLAGLARQGSGFEARIVSGGRTQTLTAGLVLGADGARSRVRRLLLPDQPGPRVMTAVQALVAADVLPEAHEVLFDARLTSYYAWAIPKPGGVLVGTAFDEARGARRRFERVLEAIRGALGLEGEARERSARGLARPGRRREACAGRERVLLAGEAAGLVSPSSGEGLSFALESGAAAGAAAGAEDPLAAYRAGFSRQAKRVAKKLLKARVIFSPLARRVALRVPWCP